MTSRFIAELAGALTLVAAAILAVLPVSFIYTSEAIPTILANLRPHMTITAIIIGLALLLMRRPLRGTITVAVAALALGYTVYKIAPHTAPAALPDSPRLKVVSFNILSGNVDGGQPITDWLRETQPDIAYIQEADPLLPHLQEVSEFLPHRVGCGRLTSTCDLVIFSRYPLDAPVSIDSQDARIGRMFQTGITFEGQHVNLIVPHLTKPYLSTDQFWEFRMITKAAKNADGPIVVAGDFNAAAWAPTFVRMLTGAELKRAALEPGTWPVLAGPLGVPIDHILTGGGATIAELKAIPSAFGSNHRGLVAEIALPPSAD